MLICTACYSSIYHLQWRYVQCGSGHSEWW